MSTNEKQQRAIRRASIYGGARLAEPLGNDRYRVTGRSGATYTVAVDGWAFRCDCPAGLADCACWHQAATWLRVRTERMTLTEVAAPAPVDQAKAERLAKARSFLTLLGGDYDRDITHGGRR